MVLGQQLAGTNSAGRTVIVLTDANGETGKAMDQDGDDWVT